MLSEMFSFKVYTVEFVSAQSDVKFNIQVTLSSQGCWVLQISYRIARVPPKLFSLGRIASMPLQPFEVMVNHIESACPERNTSCSKGNFFHPNFIKWQSGSFLTKCRHFVVF